MTRLKEVETHAPDEESEYSENFKGSFFHHHMEIWHLTIYRSEVKQDSDQIGKK